MGSAWIGLVGVVIGSVVGAGAVLLSARLTGNRAAKEAQLARRSSAYAEVIAAAGSIALMAGSIRVILAVESGLKASWLVSGKRAPSTIEVLDFLRRDIEGLLRATSHVWAFGTQEAIQSANELLDHSVTLMGLGIEKGAARAALETALRGQGWTADQEQALQSAVLRLAVLRRDFGELARRETGLSLVALFAGDETESASAEAIDERATCPTRGSRSTH